MASSKIDPPKFIDDASGYEEYKKKLLRWSRITKVVKQQQAEVVLYHLEGHPSGIQEKIDTALGDAVVNKDDGLEKVIEFMDIIYAEDPMTDAWTKYKQFIRLKKKESQPVTEFIADFDKALMKAKESGCEFSDIVLGFNLLESCDLSETDEKFILTAVDFKVGKRDKNLLEQVKNSLRKFQSHDRLSSSKDSERESFKIKQEEAFVSSVKEALVADGWKPPPSTRRKSSGSQPLKKNSPDYKGKKNPLGDDGNVMTCFKCQSEYHMADKCDADKKKKDQTEGLALSTLLSKRSTEFGMMCHVFDSNEDSELVLHHQQKQLRKQQKQLQQQEEQLLQQREQLLQLQEQLQQSARTTATMAGTTSSKAETTATMAGTTATPAGTTAKPAGTTETMEGTTATTAISARTTKKDTEVLFYDM